MKIPIAKKLRKRQQIQVAMLQDMLMEVVYSLVENPILHGGTAVWRCYGGNRFSEDLDFYFTPQADFEVKLQQALTSFGMRVSKYKTTKNVLFAKITDGETEIRLESNFVSTKDAVIGDYEKTDGSLMTVLTLPVETLITEKMGAYLHRRLVRDIYDVYHLSALVDPARVRLEVAEFLQDIPPAKDVTVLKVLLFSGVVPTFESMVQTIRSRLLR
ncbi:MAG: nucleotidyl transferase AbiEii/AbiGii toxin family protein [Promethearchaeota archaeon]